MRLTKLLIPLTIALTGVTAAPVSAAPQAAAVLSNFRNWSSVRCGGIGIAESPGTRKWDYLLESGDEGPGFAFYSGGPAVYLAKLNPKTGAQGPFVKYGAGQHTVPTGDYVILRYC